MLANLNFIHPELLIVLLQRLYLNYIAANLFYNPGLWYVIFSLF